MRDNEKVQLSCTGSSTALCLLAGFTAGVATALLLAPNSGAGTRNMIGRKFKEGEDWIKNKASEAEGRVRARGEDFLERAHEVGEVISRP